jgi:predicted component of type VI protein secretion system
MSAPHALRHGDRFVVGSYVIAVTIEEDQRQSQISNSQPKPAMSKVSGGSKIPGGSIIRHDPDRAMGSDKSVF